MTGIPVSEEVDAKCKHCLKHIQYIAALDRWVHMRDDGRPNTKIAHTAEPREERG
jgi:hypothetical protein